MKDTVVLPTLIKNKPSEIIDGICFYHRDDYNQWFETEYNTSAEPWDYSKRAGELYRHIYTVQQIRRYKPNPDTLLELGCSKGLMTKLLLPFTKTIYAADISLTALKSCRERCAEQAKKHSHQMEYFGTTTPGLPFADDSFDVVMLCDGLYAWWLSDEQKREALEDSFRVLKKGGIVIMSDCLMPEENPAIFEEYEAMARNSPLTVVDISFLYDKLWYKLESLLKKVGLDRTFNSVLSSIPLAKALNDLGRIIGRRASRHIVVVLEKK